MLDETNQAQNLFDEISDRIEGMMGDGRRYVSAIHSGDPSLMAPCGFDPMRDPMDLAMQRKYWSGFADAYEIILMWLRFCIAKEYGLRNFLLPERDLRVVVDNTKQKPREDGASSSPNDQVQEN